MGSITIKYSLMTSSAKKYIDFNELSKIVSALPATTKIGPNYYDSNTNILNIYAENDNFPDGTEIVPKYKTVHQLVNGLSIYSDLFDGLDIHNTPQPSLTSSATLTPSGTCIVPYQYKVSYISSTGAGGLGGITGSPTQTIVLPLDEVPNDLSIKNCDCGKNKHNFASHTSWCSVNK